MGEKLYWLKTDIINYRQHLKFYFHRQCSELSVPLLSACLTIVCVYMRERQTGKLITQAGQITPTRTNERQDRSLSHRQGRSLRHTRQVTQTGQIPLIQTRQVTHIGQITLTQTGQITLKRSRFTQLEEITVKAVLYIQT